MVLGGSGVVLGWFWDGSGVVLGGSALFWVALGGSELVLNGSDVVLGASGWFWWFWGASGWSWVVLGVSVGFCRFWCGSRTVLG
jgi:hypothetical protein